MHRDLLRWLAGFTVLFSALRAENAPRVAAMDFVLVGSPGSHDAGTADFSRAVQARLLGSTDFAWVERQEFERISQEADLGGVGRGDAATAIRLGNLARADLLLRGEIAAQAAGSGRLNLEVVDLKRAEVLATLTVPVSLTVRGRLLPGAKEVTAAAAGALAALQEAKHKLEQWASTAVIAPLYFKNIGKAERADFIGERVRQALVAAASPESGVRVLQFPRPAQAGEESSLVLAGLTDTAPDAWQHVADAYVWGTIKEEGADGVEFAEVPVTITLQVLAKSGTLSEATWTGPIKSLDAGLVQLGQEVQSVAKAARQGPPGTPVSRQKIAEDLRKRADETWKTIMRPQLGVPVPGMNIDYLRSTPGRQLFAYQLGLLEMACFFNPMDAGLQQARLEAAWNRNPAQPLATLRGHWLRVADYEAQARRFGRRADGSPDPVWSRLCAKQLIELAQALDRSPWTRVAGAASPEDVQRQRRSAVLRWAEIVTTPAQVALATDADNQATMEELESLENAAGDVVTAHALMERVLPALPKVVGRFLKDPARDRAHQEFIDGLYSIYNAFGEYDHLKAMLDAAWAVGTPPPPAGAAPRRPPAPQVDQPWKTPVKFVPPAIPGPAIPAIPVLEAGVQEIEAWPSMGYFQLMGNGQGFRRATGGFINTLTWHDGRLWIAQSGWPLPPEEGPPNPQGAIYLWRYDPARHVSEYMTPALGGHAPVRELLPVGQDLWMALDGDGVVRRSGVDATLQRFRAEDGVMTPRMLAAGAGRDELFFLGGMPPNYSINRYSTATGKWSGVPVPFSAAAQSMQASMMGLPGMPGFGGPPSPPQLAVCGEWLCVGTPAVAFYHLPTNTWTNLLAPAPATGVRGPAQLSFVAVCALVSADDTGFWFGNPGQLVFLNPQTPDVRKIIALPGTPQAAVHYGPWLWLLVGTNAGTQLMLIDKAAMAVVGARDLPGWLNKLAVTGDRVWAGGSQLFEVTLREPRRGGPPDIPAVAKPDLFQTVWRGDAAQLDSILAAKPEVNETSASGWTPLMAAVASGRKDLAEKLLQHGARPGLLTKNGQSALQLAAAQGDAGLVDLLLQRGADANLWLPVRLQGVPAERQWVEDLTAPPRNSYFPRQATKLTAVPTPEGMVALNWEEHDNRAEVRYQVMRNHVVIAELPPGIGHATDRTPAWGDGEAVYSVMASNISGLDEKDLQSFEEFGKLFPEAKVNLPANPPERVVRLPSMFSISGQGAALPLRVIARPALAVAAAAGGDEIVQRLLAAGANPNTPDALGETPLMAAVHEGKYATARRLLAAGADAAALSETRESAAGLAYLRHDDEPFFRELMAALPVAARARTASTLMMEAAGRGQIKDLELLRSLGGDLGATGGGGESTLSRAIMRDQEATALWLLDQGFVLHRKIRDAGGLMEMDGETWDAAVGNNRPALVKRLLAAGCDPNLAVNGKPLVVLAAERKALETLALLRDAGADLQRSTSEGKTLVNFLSEDQARVFLPGKAVGSWPMPSGETGYPAAWLHPAKRADPAKQPLTEQLVAACTAGDVAAATAAIRAGAEIDQQGEDGRTPLQHALLAQQPAVVRLLVAEGASVNIVSRSGHTPLNFAIQIGSQPEMIEFLLAQGADPNAGGRTGFSALFAAVVTANQAALTRLLAADVAVDLHWVDENTQHLRNPLTMALLKGDEEGTAKLLAAGANPRAQTYSFVLVLPQSSTRQEAKPSLLMFAAAGKRLALVKRMIALGQDPKFKTYDGYDALAWAASAGAKDVVEFLLPLSEPHGHALAEAAAAQQNAIVEILRRSGYQP